MLNAKNVASTHNRTAQHSTAQHRTQIHTYCTSSASAWSAELKLVQFAHTPQYSPGSEAQLRVVCTRSCAICTMYIRFFTKNQYEVIFTTNNK
jgi:hypothetical protein